MANRSYRSGFAFGISSFIVVALLSVISAVGTARVYGVHIIGEFALAYAPVAALWVLSTAKEQAALIKEITQLEPRHPRVTQLFAAVFTFSSCLTAAMATLAALVSWFVFRGPLHHPRLVDPAFASLAGYLIVTNTAWNIDSVFSAFVAGRQLFWVRVHETLSVMVIAIAIGLVWHSVWGLVLATIAGSLTALIHRTIVVRQLVRIRLTRREYAIGLRALPDLLRFGLRITPGNMAQGLSQQAGIWAVGAVAPAALVGAYSRAQTVPERFQTVNMRIAEVLYPTLVGRRVEGDGEGFDRALVDSARYGMIGMLLVAACGGGAARGVLDVFGPGFNRAAPALALLLLFPALTCVMFAQTQALLAVNRPGVTSVIQVLRLAVTIGLTFTLTPAIGISGPAVALVAGLLLAIGLNGISIRPFLTHRLHAVWPLREQLSLVAAYVADFAVARQVEHVFPSLAGLPASLVAGTMAYIAALVVCGGLNKRDRARLAEAFVKLRSWRSGRSVRPATVVSTSGE
jgi:O-antigen/teichoic acid export membrane protein